MTEDKLSRAYERKYEVQDYHNFSYRGTSAEKRRKLNIGDIYVNAAICGDCDYFIRSRNRHDFVTCKCGNVSVDGGSMYARRVFKNNNFIDVIEHYEDVKNEEDLPKCTEHLNGGY